MIKKITEEEWTLLQQFRLWSQKTTDSEAPLPFSYHNSERRRQWIIERLALFRPGSRLLDAGAGECQYSPHCEHLEYVSQDINEYTGDGETGLHVAGWDGSQVKVVCDIISMPFEDGEFDYVICTEVLEHVADPVAALNELVRVLKPGGEIMVTSPFCSLTHFAPYHYATGFSRYFYEYHFNRLGVRVTELDNNGNFFEYIGQEVERIPEIVERFSVSDESDLSRLARKVLWRDMVSLSESDKGSEELLAFGFHVMGVKE